jgi:hypothetical protein
MCTSFVGSMDNSDGMEKALWVARPQQEVGVSLLLCDSGQVIWSLSAAWVSLTYKMGQSQHWISRTEWMSISFFPIPSSPSLSSFFLFTF